MNTIALLIILISPAGERVETRHELDSRHVCRVEKAWAHADMRRDPKGYTFVSADCLPSDERAK